MMDDTKTIFIGIGSTTLHLLSVPIFIVVLLLKGCDTPYTQPLTVDDWVKAQGQDTVCLDDGFDAVCVKVIPGPRGERGEKGKDGKDGISIVGPQGLPGKDGALVIVQTSYLLLETESDAFVVMISRGIPEETPDTYVTPVATLEVPVGGGEPEITPINGPISVTPVAPPVADNAPTDDGIIWHVMYQAADGQATVFVYPRCFNNPYHNPPRPPCEDDFGITKDLFFEVSPGFDIEMQGTRESVQYLLGLALEEDSATLVHVSGVQGVVN